MPINKCRVCGNDFFKEPLLQYKNMPKVAQFLPDVTNLESDKGVDLQVWQCSGCGLVQLNNKPVPYYKNVIRASAFSEEMKDFRMKQFKSFVQKYSLQGKKIIEIGCGCGEYLSIMQQCGVMAYGIENSEKSKEQCVKNGLVVLKGFIDCSTKILECSPYDAFFILSFLEHLPNPNLVLRGIYNNLTNDAVGLVEVPNFDMILRNNLFSEFIGDHLFYFNKETLTSTLNQNGFEILECNEIWYNYIISVVVQPVRNYLTKTGKVEWSNDKRIAEASNRIKKREKLNLSHFYQLQEKLKIEIHKYINRFDHKMVAVWGAGHQALAIISLMNLSDKIKYVVDSAPFKQNKFTPATHIPIVSPEQLITEPVDAIIVMAASYSSEVVKIIQQNFDRNINVSILKDFGLEEVKE